MQQSWEAGPNGRYLVHDGCTQVDGLMPITKGLEAVISCLWNSLVCHGMMQHDSPHQMPASMLSDTENMNQINFYLCKLPSLRYSVIAAEDGQR